jgi:hypothetical protein
MPEGRDVLYNKIVTAADSVCPAERLGASTLIPTAMSVRERRDHYRSHSGAGAGRDGGSPRNGYPARDWIAVSANV